MNDHEPQDPTTGAEPKKTPARRETPLPFAGAPPRPGARELDLDVDGIETRLPYGSEDIADK